MIQIIGQKRLMAEVRAAWLERSIERQRGRCHYCGVAMSRSQHKDYRRFRPTLDHIIPLGAGGEDVEENTVAACYGCNHDKGCMMPWDFIAKLGEGDGDQTETCGHRPQSPPADVRQACAGGDAGRGQAT